MPAIEEGVRGGDGGGGGGGGGGSGGCDDDDDDDDDRLTCTAAWPSPTRPLPRALEAQGGRERS